MRRIAILIVLLAGVGLSAAALSLCDYQSPETSITDASMSFSYRYFDDPDTPGVDTSTGRVAATYSQLVDTPSYGFSADVSGEIGLTEFMPSNWLGQGAVSFRYYVLQDMPLFGFGGVQANMATGQPQAGVVLRSGFGYGRFYDVTPLAKASTIAKTLRANGTITAALPDDVIMSIATTIGKRVEYASMTELVAAVEKLVEDASGVTLNARSLLMIEDVINQTNDDRFCGWAVQAGIGYELVDPYGGEQNFVFVLAGDMAYAPNEMSQMQGHVSLTGPFDIMEENTLAASLTYNTEVSDTTSMQAAYTLQRVKPLGLDAVTTHRIGIDLAANVAGADVVLGISTHRTTGDSGWTFDITISAALTLL